MTQSVTSTNCKGTALAISNLKANTLYTFVLEIESVDVLETTQKRYSIAQFTTDPFNYAISGLTVTELTPESFTVTFNRPAEAKNVQLILGSDRKTKTYDGLPGDVLSDLASLFGHVQQIQYLSSGETSTEFVGLDPGTEYTLIAVVCDPDDVVNRMIAETSVGILVKTPPLQEETKATTTATTTTTTTTTTTVTTKPTTSTATTKATTSTSTTTTTVTTKPTDSTTTTTTVTTKPTESTTTTTTATTKPTETTSTAVTTTTIHTDPTTIPTETTVETQETTTSATEETATEAELTLSKTELTLHPGEQYKIEANLTGLSYDSSEHQVAVVSTNGTIFAVAPGTAIITVSDGNDRTAQITLTVEDEATDFLLGDVNDDGIINASDAAKILVAAAQIDAGYASGLTPQKELAANVNGDANINASDAAVVLIYAAAVGAGQTDAKLTDFVKH